MTARPVANNAGALYPFVNHRSASKGLEAVQLRPSLTPEVRPATFS